ncbi:MAG: DJ-1/PfpI family protein [Nitrospira sp.]|nr:DJ-1/PfpI family protein [Nitrospira sp.]MDH5251801.1 DJ-1/PfpI family protein [Nitrospira sp.]
MAFKIAFLVYNGVAELDFVGPKDVFFASSWMAKRNDELYLVAPSKDPVTCLGGLRVLPDYDFASAPLPDLLVVPGTAEPTPQIDNPELLAWVDTASSNCLWTTSVCTGAAILLAAGPAKGHRITSHSMAIESLRAQNEATVLDHVRYVVDGQIVTSAGVSAGIDMALWLVGRLHGADHARAVQQVLEYYPEPPYGLEPAAASCR